MGVQGVFAVQPEFVRQQIQSVMSDIQVGANNHKTTSKNCPEYNRQKNIKQLMAFENLTFFDANEICRKTYLIKDHSIYNSNDFPAIQKKT